jgi:hypothetical protein
MEKRRHRRIKVDLKAERLYGNEKFGVFIEDISENGIHMLTSPLKKHEKYTPGTDIDLRFHLSSGETLSLFCKVRWAHVKTPPNGLTDSIGLEIVNPPSRFIKFVRSLH